MRGSVRKFLATFLVIILLIAQLPLLVDAADYRDTSGHWAQKVITKWSEKGILVGSNDMFRPNDSITRAEFSAILNRVMRYTQTIENSFSDLSSGKWYYNDVIKLTAAGILKGSGGKAYPENKITRQEASALMARAFNLDIPSSGSTKFVDDADISSWAKGACTIMAKSGYIKGFDGKFYPQNNLTRAEAVQILDNMVKLLVNGSGEYSEDIEGNVVVSASGAVLKNMSISGDLYLSEGIDDGDVSLDGVTVKGSVIVKGGGNDSIKIKDSNISSIIIMKQGDEVRVVSEGSSAILLAEINGDAILDGKFKDVVIVGDVNVVINGTIEALKVEGNASIVNNGTIDEVYIDARTAIENNGTITTLNANKKVKIKGEGVVTTANIAKGAADSEFETEPAKINLAEGISVIVAGKTVTKAEKSEETPSGGTPGGDQGGGYEEPIVFFKITDASVPSVLRDYKTKVLDNGNNYEKIDYTVIYQPSILPVHSVNVTIFDADKNIWVGTDEGLKCLNIQSGTVKDYSTDEYLSDKKVDGLYISPESPNFIWVLTGDDVTRIKYR